MKTIKTNYLSQFFLWLLSFSLVCPMGAQVAPTAASQQLEDTKAAAAAAAAAATSAATAATSAAAAASDANKAIKAMQDNAVSDLMKNFGAGIGVTIDTGTRSRIDDATVDVNGVVRVNKKSNNAARFFLEAHALSLLKKDSKGTKVADSTAGERTPSRAFGPFAALQLGGDQVIQSLGAGLMYGWRGANPDAKGSFNFGLGYVLDPAVKVLGDEFKENQPAPKDAAGKPLPIRYATKDKGAILLLVSFGL